AQGTPPAGLPLASPTNDTTALSNHSRSSQSALHQEFALVTCQFCGKNVSQSIFVSQHLPNCESYRLGQKKATVKSEPQPNGVTEVESPSAKGANGSASKKRKSSVVSDSAGSFSSAATGNATGNGTPSKRSKAAKSKSEFVGGRGGALAFS